MRYSNTTLTSRSVRTNLSCFDDFDIVRLGPRRDYLVNFISQGVNKCPTYIHRPVSILWPDSYDKMAEQLAELDAHLINTEFKERPIEWMFERGLTTVPTCKFCESKMTLHYEDDKARWNCLKTEACLSLFAPIQRPLFFYKYENVGLLKILFAIYFWSTCTQFDLVTERLQLQLDRRILFGIWRSVQNVCRLALEKANPFFKLSNIPDETGKQLPIDLLSIKLNQDYIVCAKHPLSSQVRLGLFIPNVSRYSYVELTESWFAEGAHVRVCETRFIDLTKRRPDLRVQLTDRSDMVSRNGAFNRNSAFGYLICQLTHVFKDFESSTVSRETLKLILAEMQWRELYGTTPMNAFTNIIKHIALYEQASINYSEVINNGDNAAKESEAQTESSYVYAEKYFYAKIEPIDEKGNVVSTFRHGESECQVARFFCHICNQSFESFYYSLHMMGHVELNRLTKGEDLTIFHKSVSGLYECKHCFKFFTRQHFSDHSALYQMHLHSIKYGCRICCIKFENRRVYLQHMRRMHFECETPYRCPKCKFSSSFQRELFIHFQEEHRNTFTIMCLFCLRSFTIIEPKLLNKDMMQRVSRTIYSHFMDHYIKRGKYSCDNCCLCFISNEKLRQHKIQAHNPLEIVQEEEVRVERFIVTSEEQPFCVQAMPMELFIANKQPNKPIDESHQAAMSLEATSCVVNPKVEKSNRNRRSTRSAGSSSDDKSCDDDSDDSSMIDINDGTIHVRRPSKARKFLDGGKPAFKVSSKRPTASTSTKSLTSEKLLEFMWKFKRADGVLPNQSVILNPNNQPTKCAECAQYLTVDHYVSAISCRQCGHLTHCPRSAIEHMSSVHQKFAKT